MQQRDDGKERFGAVEDAQGDVVVLTAQACGGALFEFGPMLSTAARRAQSAGVPRHFCSTFAGPLITNFLRNPRKALPLAMKEAIRLMVQEFDQPGF
ncbi:hypothetical protein ABR737_43180 [Streptomyces sp. Edi2]|uniref:hypothetical protein n=1 Tax=Streptomyces sp. Edi2 TaxID=3162528 RepID=UPI0033060D93